MRDWPYPWVTQRSWGAATCLPAVCSPRPPPCPPSSQKWRWQASSISRSSASTLAKWWVLVAFCVCVGVKRWSTPVVYQLLQKVSTVSPGISLKRFSWKWDALSPQNDIITAKLSLTCLCYFRLITVSCRLSHQTSWQAHNTALSENQHNFWVKSLTLYMKDYEYYKPFKTCKDSLGYQVHFQYC